MNAAAKEILRVQKKQFEMGLLWIKVIESPNATNEERKIAIEQYATLLNMIFEIQCELLSIDLTKTLLEYDNA